MGQPIPSRKAHNQHNLYPQFKGKAHDTNYTREETVVKFMDWFDNTELDQYLEELRGKDLACWCAPLDCHADYLLMLANTPKDAEPEPDLDLSSILEGLF